MGNLANIDSGSASRFVETAEVAFR